MYRCIRASLLLAVAALAVTAVTATAQDSKWFKNDRATASTATANDLKSNGLATAKTSIGGLELPGPDLPDYPPASLRFHDGVLYVEATQGHDWISVSAPIAPTGYIQVRIWDQFDYTTHLDEFVGTWDLELIVVYGLAGDDILLSKSDIPIVFIGGLGVDDWTKL